MSKLVISKPEELNQPAVVSKLMDRLAQVIDDTDEQAAAHRVAQLRADYPDAALDQLADKLILNKCRDTAVVGATTSGLAIVPGLGTVLSLSLGVAADLGITFKLQAELVLELAELYGYPLKAQEKRQVVMLVTGLSAGTTAVAHRMGKQVSRRLTARIGSKYVTRAVPVIGMAASASTNAVMTYYIGQRTKAYFTLSPEEMQDWSLALPALTGVSWQTITHSAQVGGRALTQAGNTAVAATVAGAKSGVQKVKDRRQNQDELVKLPEGQSDRPKLGRIKLSRGKRPKSANMLPDEEDILVIDMGNPTEWQQ
jgi:uncharacterized protein (DUF697 family)